MGNALSSAMTDAWLADHKKRVRKWLAKATQDSVLETLTSRFFPGGKRYGALGDARFHIKETFRAYGSIDPIDKKRYWCETDLRLFLSNRFSGSELNASIPILWRCFYFHAYFPFFQQAQRLDYGGFQRAIALLAGEGSLRLGNNADGITMDADKYPDDNARASKRLWMMFRSLSNRSPHPHGSKPIGSSATDMSSMEEDLMEVLALCQPDNACIMPAPIEELRSDAQRILSSSAPCVYSSIPREDLLALFKLLLSVQLDKPEWGDHEPFFYTGGISIHPDSEILRVAADALLNRFTSSDKSDIDWEAFKEILSVYLPDFPCQFRLVFTSFLSPLRSVNETLNTPVPTSTIPVPYAQYLNLFLHPPLLHPARHVFEEFARQEAHYALQTSHTVYSASPPTFNTSDLIAALGPIKTGTLLLITGEAIETGPRPPTRVTIGACMPTPWDIDRQRSFRASPPQKLHRYTPEHMLFQLEPREEILRPEADAWIMDLIHITGSDRERKTKGGFRLGAQGATSGLSVDFDSGIATLKSITTNEENPSAGPYHPIIPTSNRRNPTSWETRMHIQQLSIYNLGGHATAAFEEQLADKPRLRTSSPPPSRPQVIKGSVAPEPKTSEPRVGSEELRSRIQGFGPSAR